MNRHTAAEVAVMLRVSVKTVDRLRKTGQLPYLPGRPVTIARAPPNASRNGVGMSLAWPGSPSMASFPAIFTLPI